MGIKVHSSADVEDGAILGDGTTVWHLVHVRENAVLGENCTVGRGAYIGAGVRIGDNVKIQNSALIYEPAVLGDGVFIGPAVVLTNDLYPRAVDPDGSLKSGDEWTAQGVVVQRGAAIGAGSVVVAGVTIGEWALVGAGAVVVADVASHALVVGNPARQIGWVGRTGRRLEADGDHLRCAETGDRFVVADGLLKRIESA